MTSTVVVNGDPPGPCGPPGRRFIGGTCGGGTPSCIEFGGGASGGGGGPPVGSGGGGRPAMVLVICFSFLVVVVVLHGVRANHC